MEKLPLEMVIKILSYLNIKTLFNSRLVNKKWRFAAKYVKILELTFQDVMFYIENNWGECCVWVHTGDLFKNIIKFNHENSKLFKINKFN